jgi:hypothetical protein
VIFYRNTINNLINNEFASLNVFGNKQTEVPKQQNSSKPTRANLPQGISGFDLFE